MQENPGLGPKAAPWISGQEGGWKSSAHGMVREGRSTRVHKVATAGEHAELVDG